MDPLKGIRESLKAVMEGAVDDFELLFAGKFDEIDRVTRNADG